jgi:hypothetical protein
VSDLAKPPATARHFVIQSTGGKHGDSWIWTAPSGARVNRESVNLRGQVFELDSEGETGADGMPLAVAIRGVTPSSAFHQPQGGPIDLTAWFLEALLARPGKTLDLPPGGKAHAEKRADLVAGAGSAKRTIAHGPSPASTRRQRRYGRTQAMSYILLCLASRRAKNSPSRSGLRNGLRVS